MIEYLTRVEGKAEGNKNRDEILGQEKKQLGEINLEIYVTHHDKNVL